MHNITIFSCYASEDKQLYNKLKTCLSPVMRTDYVVFQTSDEIIAGSERIQTIISQVTKANIILLLISPHFIASEDCYNIVMQQALQRHQTGAACVVPILLRPILRDYMPFSTLKLLPSNARPITSWRDRNETFQEVAERINEIIIRLSKSLVTAIENGRRETTEINKDRSSILKPNSPPKLPIYLSDTKIGFLEPLIIHPQTVITPIQKRLQALTSVLDTLETSKQIKNLQGVSNIKENDYIYGQYDLHWGIIDWGPKVVFFFSTKTPMFLLMAGSEHHIIDNFPKKHSLTKQQIGASGSNLVGILGAIQFAADNKFKWTEGIGTITDYLFALALIHENFMSQLRVRKLATPFPEQHLEFVAIVLKILLKPSGKQIKQVLIQNNVSKQDKQTIEQMLHTATNIAICSPLYVSHPQNQ